MPEMSLADHRKAEDLLLHAAELHTTKLKDGVEVPAPIDHRPYELLHEEPGPLSCPVCEALLCIQEARELIAAELPQEPPPVVEPQA